VPETGTLYLMTDLPMTVETYERWRRRGTEHLARRNNLVCLQGANFGLTLRFYIMSTSREYGGRGRIAA
jgi:hypothetical protein